MNALTKSLQRANALVTTTHAVALRLKELGVADRLAGGGGGLASDWQQQGQNKTAYAQNRSWVYAAINALASEAAAQPVKIGRLKKKEASGKRGSKLRSKALLFNRMTDNIRSKAADNEMEMLPEHPLAKLLEKPNPLQHRFQFVYTFVANLNLTGRAYVIRDEEDGEPVYYSLPSTWVRADHSKGPYSQFFIQNPKSVDYAGAGEPIDPENVSMAYLPNPADPLGAISPASSQASAIRIDDRIQVCQEKFFDNAPFPSVIVTIGKDPHPDVPGGIRPRLTGPQRRQVVGAIRRTMGSVANYGNPAIVDGLIESITPFGRAQDEIGWEKSEDKIKARILSAFCVHPYILGDPVGVGGYAQVYSIEKRFCKRINVFLDMLSSLMTEFFRIEDEDQEEEPENSLLIWWEKAQAEDPSMERQDLRFSRQNGDISQNEWRAKLGLPPDEDRNEATVSTGQCTAITQLLAQVGGGAIKRDQAAALLKGMGLPDELAEDIAGPEPPPEPQPQQAPPQTPQGGIGSEVPEEGSQPPKPGQQPPGKPPRPPKPGQAVEELNKAIDELCGVDEIAERIYSML